MKSGKGGGERRRRPEQEMARRGKRMTPFSLKFQPKTCDHDRHLSLSLSNYELDALTPHTLEYFNAYTYV